ncbi:pleckstrin homology domain-containing family F member 2 [Hippoglossus stenolepis]|uniref:pleckstrin homology domain-containing family F member 2 n=1 Tax=Hippoglossus stenolepis TaxID=195615 RepID=UPI00159CC33F|nr:pleckstrin homology domain-containing family F member 2 [Hippoglossus stenolepis]
MDKVTFMSENRERIQALESSFGPSGRPLYKPDRVLVGQGHLMKQGQRRTEMKAFFLFNDILVYGSMILNGRWHKKVKIIPLEDLQLEDMEDSVRLTNQWLIRTPSKSFFVSASSHEDKRAWMDHIEECRAKMLQGGSCQPGSTFAVSWIPDKAAYKCMRCFNKFTPTNRRHHCRQCGFVVCHSCSSTRVVIGHIHPKKKLRVCRLCHKRNTEEETSRVSGDSPGNSSSVEDIVTSSSGEEDEDEVMPSSRLNSHVGTWGEIGTYTPHTALLLPPSYT